MGKPERTRVITLLTIAAISLALLVGCVRIETVSSPEMRALVRSDISQIMTDIDEDQTGVGASSNPYDYLGVSPAFGRLVDRGPDALDAIASEIAESEHNGLREYLLAMAGNSILGRDERIGFSTAKEWAAQYQSQR